MKYLPKISSISNLLKSNYELTKWGGFINKSQWWSEEQHTEYQWKSIKQLLQYSYDKIPYYQEIFRDINAKPKDFNSFKDFIEFPFLTKRIIRERLNDLIPANFDKRKLILYNTGGSTGEPLSFYKTKRDDSIEKAFMTSQWARVGYKKNDSRVIIRGEVLKDGKLWEQGINPNTWKISAYHLSEKNISNLAAKLNEIKPKFIHVYPTSLQIFTQLLVEKNIQLTFTPKAILCGSEKLYDHQRHFFETFYKCRVFSWLGLAEQTILAGECEKSSKLHIFSEHSYVELIDNENNVIMQGGKTGEIIGTRLHRFIIPFIRYRSGDIASYSNEKCACNRNYKILEDVEGRVQDIVITSGGRNIPVTALFFGQHLTVFEKALKIQLIQNSKGEVFIKIVKGSSYSIDDEAELLAKLAKATDSEILFKIEYVSDIEPTSRGKHKFLISKIQ